MQYSNDSAENRLKDWLICDVQCFWKCDMYALLLKYNSQFFIHAWMKWMNEIFTAISVLFIKSMSYTEAHLLPQVIAGFQSVTKDRLTLFI